MSCEVYALFEPINAHKIFYESFSFATLANAPARPKNVNIEISTLENNITLSWEANMEPDLKGYEILWRKPHAPYWQHHKFVGDTTRFTIKNVSKDNPDYSQRNLVVSKAG